MPTPLGLCGTLDPILSGALVSVVLEVTRTINDCFVRFNLGYLKHHKIIGKTNRMRT
jgi:hypothetical protein